MLVVSAPAGTTSMQSSGERLELLLIFRTILILSVLILSWVCILHHGHVHRACCGAIPTAAPLSSTVSVMWRTVCFHEHRMCGRHIRFLPHQHNQGRRPQKRTVWSLLTLVAFSMKLHGLLSSASNIRISIVSPAGMACSAVTLHWWSHEVNNLFPINEKISCIRKGTQLKVKRAASGKL